jgi:hypothetical protein
MKAGSSCGGYNFSAALQPKKGKSLAWKFTRSNLMAAGYSQSVLLLFHYKSRQTFPTDYIPSQLGRQVSPQWVVKASTGKVVDDIFIHCFITIYPFIRSDND